MPQTTPLIPDKDYSGPSRPDGATIFSNDPLFISPAPPAKDAKGASIPSPDSNTGLAPAPARVNAAPAGVVAPVAGFPVVTDYRKLFFTGRTGVGKDWLAAQVKAQVLDSSAPLVAAARAMFPQATKPEHFAGLFPTIYAWGDGIISKDTPLTPARWLFCRMAAEQWPGFGSPGFWMHLLLETANAIDGRVAVTNVTTGAAFTALKEAGFAHFHVMTSPAVYMQRAKRPGANDAMATALDNDAIKKVSAQRDGAKLPVIWNSPEAPPSTRLWTVAEFLAAMNAAPEEPTFSAFE